MNKRKQKLRDQQSPRQTGTMTGELHMARNGAGFLVDPETNEAFWIDREDLGTALVGDRVTIKVTERRPVCPPVSKCGRSVGRAVPVRGAGLWSQQ